ncbi:MAG TPA: TetR-like C-terminal domain-containing protein, partial [Pseudomonadales bacterium]|nr:TetR-like C-terminal domain-containing protein [Pseudomonadales bacterium]
ALDRLIQAIDVKKRHTREGLKQLIYSYVHFAADNPELYDLMFGRMIWKTGSPTESLKQTAFAAFKKYVEKTASLNANKNTLRVAQVSWATLHGICKFIIDGIYVNRDDLDAICDQALTMLLAFEQVEKISK